jgi:hypothetical protein
MLKEVIMVYFKVLLQYLYGRTEENYKTNSQGEEYYLLGNYQVSGHFRGTYHLHLQG